MRTQGQWLFFFLFNWVNHSDIYWEGDTWAKPKDFFFSYASSEIPIRQLRSGTEWMAGYGNLGLEGRVGRERICEVASL